MDTPNLPETASARDFFNQDDATLAAVLMPDAPPVEGEAPVQEEPQLGAFVSAPPEQEDEQGGEAAPPEVEDEVEIKPLDRKPVTEFAVLDEAGEVEIPDIKIRFKAKGEVRELPLDTVVRMAQWGFSNEEREQQVMAARKFVTEAQQKEAEYQQAIQQYESHYERLFSDPVAYEEARLAYLQQNSPEARAARAEQQLARVEQERRQAAEDGAISGFVQQRLVPTVQTLLTKHPGVNEHEVLGRYTELVAPLLVRGRVPVERLPYVERLVAQDLTDWVARVDYERSITRKQETQKVEQAQAAATQKVAETKRQAARVFSQRGASAGLTEGKPLKYDSAKDWLNSTFGNND